MSRRAVAYMLAWMIDHGLLARMVPGTTVRFRKGTMRGQEDDGRGNEAAQYLLIIPTAILEADDDLPATAAPAADDEVPWPCETVPTRPHLDLVPDVPAAQTLVDETCTPQPSPTPVGEESSRNAGARGPAELASPPASWPAAVTPVTKRDRLAVCERLIRELPVLRGISARHLRSALRPVFDLGATVGDIRHALDVRPDDTPWIHTDAPRWIPGWVRHRLSAWITSTGQLAAPWPSQRRAAAHRELLAEQQARREQYEQARRSRTGEAGTPIDETETPAP
jgi:hypothetical protein